MALKVLSVPHPFLPLASCQPQTEELLRHNSTAILSSALLQPKVTESANRLKPVATEKRGLINTTESHIKEKPPQKGRVFF